jgi:7,8-dihydropterin-6-yl-methyl-4-(beta-D-ribofuranosyl)aminobenzene 5'-phosphate synthase
LPEHGLVLRTSDGLVIITGCAHPGIVEIVEKAIEAFPEEPVDLVLGGLHLGMATVQEVTQIIDGLRTLGVRRVAPSHCTGDRSKSLFALAFGDDFIDIGAGAVLEFAP